MIRPILGASAPALQSRRSRQLFGAVLATLAVVTGLLGMVVFVQWRTERAVQSDAGAILTQSSQQLVRALQSRRGTLTLLRDTLDRSPSLNEVEQQALAKSAVSHTRHLLGIGLVRATHPLSWWSAPEMSKPDLTHIQKVVSQRTKLVGSWRVPGTTSLVNQMDQPVLVMLEPLRASANRRSALVGVFMLRSLLQDFFEYSLKLPYPVQVLEGSRVLYESEGWQAGEESGKVRILSRSVTIDNLRWTLNLQPGKSTQMAKAMSWSQRLLTIVSLLAGIVAIGLIWLLAMRTWILQRIVERRTAALRRTTDRLRKLAVTDELTGLYNRRFFMERWQWECDRSKRYHRPLGCLMIDVDRFKQINDTFGHHTGDLLLKQVAAELRHHLRQSDILARFGGDEFIVALPETTLEQASAVADKLRQLVIQSPTSKGRDTQSVRLSVGVSHAQKDDTPEDIIKHADANLYAIRQAVRQTGPRPSANPVPAEPAARSRR